jgi:hypothetical protein
MVSANDKAPGHSTGSHARAAVLNVVSLIDKVS